MHCTYHILYVIFPPLEIGVEIQIVLLKCIMHYTLSVRKFIFPLKNVTLLPMKEKKETLS